MKMVETTQNEIIPQENHQSSSSQAASITLRPLPPSPPSLKDKTNGSRSSSKRSRLRRKRKEHYRSTQQLQNERSTSPDCEPEGEPQDNNQRKGGAKRNLVSSIVPGSQPTNLPGSRRSRSTLGICHDELDIVELATPTTMTATITRPARQAELFEDSNIESKLNFHHVKETENIVDTDSISTIYSTHKRPYQSKPDLGTFRFFPDGIGNLSQSADAVAIPQNIRASDRRKCDDKRSRDKQIHNKRTQDWIEATPFAHDTQNSLKEIDLSRTTSMIKLFSEATKTSSILDTGERRLGKPYRTLRHRSGSLEKLRKVMEKVHPPNPPPMPSLPDLPFEIVMHERMTKINIETQLRFQKFKEWLQRFKIQWLDKKRASVSNGIMNRLRATKETIMRPLKKIWWPVVIEDGPKRRFMMGETPFWEGCRLRPSGRGLYDRVGEDDSSNEEECDHDDDDDDDNDENDSDSDFDNDVNKDYDLYADENNVDSYCSRKGNNAQDRCQDVYSSSVSRGKTYPTKQKLNSMSGKLESYKMSYARSYGPRTKVDEKNYEHSCCNDGKKNTHGKVRRHVSFADVPDDIHALTDYRPDVRVSVGQGNRVNARNGVRQPNDHAHNSVNEGLIYDYDNQNKKPTRYDILKPIRYETLFGLNKSHQDEHGDENDISFEEKRGKPVRKQQRKNIMSYDKNVTAWLDDTSGKNARCRGKDATLTSEKELITWLDSIPTCTSRGKDADRDAEGEGTRREGHGDEMKPLSFEEINERFNETRDKVKLMLKKFDDPEWCQKWIKEQDEASAKQMIANQKRFDFMRAVAFVMEQSESQRSLSWTMGSMNFLQNALTSNRDDFEERMWRRVNYRFAHHRFGMDGKQPTVKLDSGSLPGVAPTLSCRQLDNVKCPQPMYTDSRSGCIACRIMKTAQHFGCDHRLCFSEYLLTKLFDNA